MSLVEWNDGLSVGVEDLDNDHKILMGFVNELHDAINADKEHEVIGYIIDTLVDYTEIHFKREEKMFEDSAYPDIEAHKKLHKNLTNKVKDIQKLHMMGSVSVSEETLSFLKNWLVNHIQGVDKKYEAYINRVDGA